MAAITTRAGKGSPLTNAEVDANFTNLNTGKLEARNNLSDITDVEAAKRNLGLGEQVAGAQNLSQSIAMAIALG